MTTQQYKSLFSFTVIVISISLVKNLRHFIKAQEIWPKYTAETYASLGSLAPLFLFLISRLWDTNWMTTTSMVGAAS